MYTNDLFQKPVRSRKSKQQQQEPNSYVFSSKAQSAKRLIQGRKITNHIHFDHIKTSKHIQLRDALIQNQEHHESDSFKELLSKRSCKILNKQNFHTNSISSNRNKSKKIFKTLKTEKQVNIAKQIPGQQKQVNTIQVQTNRPLNKKSKSFGRLARKNQFQQGQKERKQRRKSQSPHCSKSKSHRNFQKYDTKNNYVSGPPNCLKNLSDRQLISSSVHKKRTDRASTNHNRIASEDNTKQKKQFLKQNIKKHKRKQSQTSNIGKLNSSKKLNFCQSKVKLMNPSHLTSKTQPLAKQFDIMYRKQRPVKNKAKKSSKTSKNCSKQQSKKILISKNGADSRKVPHFISQYQDLQNSGNELQQYGNILQTKYRNKQKQVLIASKSKSKSKSRSKQRLSLNQKTKRKVMQKSVKTEFMQSPNDITLRNKKDIQGFKQYLNQKQEFKQNESQGLKRHQAALMIQKNFRGYMIRKYLMQYRTVVHSVILIQKHARGFLARRKLKKAAHLKKTLSLQIATKLQVRKEQDQIYEKDSQFKTSRRILQEQSPVRIHEILQKSLSKASQQQIQKWTDILQEILYREQVDQNIKLRILDFLEKHSNKQSPKSNEKSFCDKVLQSQIQSQKRFIQQKKKYFKEKIFSPRSQRSGKSLKSAYQNSFSVNQPVFLMDNLVILQKVHKQKLIDSAQKEKLNLQIMFKKKYFSPRTHQSKRQEIEERLKRQIQKFQSGMEQVLKSCQSNQQVLSRLANTPSRKGQANQPSPRSQLFSPLIRQAQTPSSEDRLKLLGQKDEEDQNNPIIYKNSYSQLALRQQISEKYQEIEQGNGLEHQMSSRFSSQTNQNQTIQPFESSFQFIEDYLLSLIEFFRSSQSKSQRRSQFLVKMKESKNLKVDMVLKNLPLVTQQSEEDTTFKLPLYKYLENQDIQLIQKQIVEDFNRSYTALQRHQLSGRSKNLSQNIQQIYLKMVIDCFNQALNQQRPLMYIFTQQSLKSKSKPRLSELNIQNSPELLLNDESLASFYFATAMNRVYKWASTLCGSFSLTDLPMQIQKQAVYGISQMSQQQNSLHILINQARQRQMVNMQANKPWIFYDQLIQIIVGVSDAVFDEIILEQGAMLFF